MLVVCDHEPEAEPLLLVPAVGLGRVESTYYVRSTVKSIPCLQERLFSRQIDSPARHDLKLA